MPLSDENIATLLIPAECMKISKSNYAPGPLGWFAFFATYPGFTKIGFMLF